MTGAVSIPVAGNSRGDQAINPLAGGRHADPLGIVPRAQDYAGGFVLLASRRDNLAATGGVLALDTGIAVRGIGRTSAGWGLAAKYEPTRLRNS